MTDLGRVEEQNAAVATEDTSSQGSIPTEEPTARLLRDVEDAVTPHDTLKTLKEVGATGENFSEEYNKARFIGTTLLPLFSDGSTGLVRPFDASVHERDRYVKALAPVDTGGVATPEDVARAMKASIQLSLRAAEEVARKSFKFKDRVTTLDSMSARQIQELYTLQQGIQLGTSFLEEQNELNPDLVRSVLRGYHLDSGSIVGVQDEQAQLDRARQLLDSGLRKFPRTGIDVLGNPFHPYRKNIQRISQEIPHIPSVDTLHPDPKKAEKITFKARLQAKLAGFKRSSRKDVQQEAVPVEA